jgi:hypothetical protein
MEWYEILGFVVFWFVGALPEREVLLELRDRGYNRNWRKRK